MKKFTGMIMAALLLGEDGRPDIDRITHGDPPAWSELYEG